MLRQILDSPAGSVMERMREERFVSSAAGDTWLNNMAAYVKETSCYVDIKPY